MIMQWCSVTKMEDIREQSCPECIITTPKHLEGSVWKYFGFYTVDGKVTNKDKAVCRLYKGNCHTLQLQ